MKRPESRTQKPVEEENLSPGLPTLIGIPASGGVTAVWFSIERLSQAYTYLAEKTVSFEISQMGDDRTIGTVY